MIFTIGHQKPDLDSISAAFGLAALLKAEGISSVTPARASDSVPKYVTWLFDKLGEQVPAFIDDVSSKEIFLVDHTEPAQSPLGISKAQVVGVFDHHPDCGSVDYPDCTIDLIGSTSTLIAEKFILKNLPIGKNLATILLAAILDDTIIFKSVTTTERDTDVAKNLAQIAGIPDLEKFGLEIFTAKSNWSEMTPSQMIEVDAKEWDFKGTKIFCPTIETVDSDILIPQFSEILQAINSKKSSGGFDLVLGIVVDIWKEKSWILIDPADKAPIETIFDGSVSDDGIMEIKDVISRKKQVLKPLQDLFQSQS